MKAQAMEQSATTTSGSALRLRSHGGRESSHSEIWFGRPMAMARLDDRTPSAVVRRSAGTLEPAPPIVQIC
jgi:hypothetical protein